MSISYWLDHSKDKVINCDITIIGGGIVFGLSGSWMYVFIYEIILLLVAGGFVAK